MMSDRDLDAERDHATSDRAAWASRFSRGAAKPVGPLVRFLYRCERWATHSQARIRRQEQWLTGDDSPLDQAQLATCAGISREISRRDTMYRGDLEHYWRVGLSALDCIDEVLDRSPGLVVRDVLDLPCGYGRILRFLGRRFPGATLHACDVDRRAVDYCVKAFGARGTYSRRDLDAFTVDARFDLAWCGSLVTHLDAARIASLLKLFGRHLRPGGLLILTTHGRRTVEYLESGAGLYKLRPRQVRTLLSQYAECGYAFTPYPAQLGYGISVTSLAWLRRLWGLGSGWQEVYFAENRWDDHEDVIGLTKLDAA
jgi:SAM-dependent methyltransferase